MADPTTVAGWDVKRRSWGCHAKQGRYGSEVEIVGDSLIVQCDCGGDGMSAPVPVLLAMLRALGYEIRGPGGE